MIVIVSIFCLLKVHQKDIYIYIVYIAIKLLTPPLTHTLHNHDIVPRSREAECILD